MIYFVHSNMVFEKKNSSTELAALKLLDRVLGQMDKHKIPINFQLIYRKRLTACDMMFFLISYLIMV